MLKLFREIYKNDYNINKMKSLRQLYRIGHGPSSSHAMGPGLAVQALKQRYANIQSVKVVLYESLAFTGKGHLTDRILTDEFFPIPITIIFDLKTKTPHPNTMDFFLSMKEGNPIFHRVESVGGGALRWVGEKDDIPDVYRENKLTAIKKLCQDKQWRFSDYVFYHENQDFKAYLNTIMLQMLSTIEEGLKTEGLLPGTLKVHRRAFKFIKPLHEHETLPQREHRLLSAYAFAVNEVNAAGGIVVTAPTCGASGTLPAVLKYIMEEEQVPIEKILNGLAVAGLIGNLIKKNASISGAESGCQAEVGSACSMAAAFYGEVLGLSLDQIEYAAEVGMEHHLGLTCDPIQGYVQIPCIERNAVAALKAIHATRLAQFATENHKISFDLVIDTMYQTGKDMNQKYKETSKGGLAKKYRVS
jgi:L-serine dehydratase